MTLAASDPLELSVALERTAQKIGQLVDDVLAGRHVEAAWAQEAVAEFSTGMEELRVAEEELRVQAEQLAASRDAIDAERERYADLFEYAPDGYLETDELGKIAEANSAATHLLGVPARFLAGKLIHSFVAPDHRRAVRAHLAAAAAVGEPQELTVVLEPRDGPPVWVEIRVGGYFDPVADRHRLRWLLRDVSRRMKLERELSELQVSVELLSALAEVNRLVEAEEDTLASVLGRLVELAHRVTAAEAGILLAGDDGGVAVRAVAGASAGELCQQQLSGGGPGVQTQHDGMPRAVLVEALGEWPDLARLAQRHHLRGLVAHPIRIDGAVIGTVNLYVRGDVEEAAHLAKLLADNAAASISNAQVYAGARHLAAHLGRALESRGVIEQAKGVLIAMQRCTPDEAFDILRRSSQRQNRKLRAIAEEIVERFAGSSQAASN